MNRKLITIIHIGILLSLVYPIKLHAFPAAGRNQQPSTLPYAHFPLIDRISSNFITSFAEAPDGYMWIATNHGLNRYSGANYAVFYAQKEPTALNSDYVSNLMLDEDNRLWMSNECGLCVLENGQFRHLQSMGFNPLGRVLDLDSEWLIVTDRVGIAKVSKQTLQTKNYFPHNQMSTINAIAISDEKQVWTANLPEHATGIYILNEDLKLMQTIRCPAEVNVTDIVKGPRKQMWVVTNRQLLCYDATTKQEIPIAGCLMQATWQQKIHFLLPYGPDALLVGIGGKGMFRYDLQEQTLEQIHAQQKLKGKTYVCFIDSHEGIWLSDQENDFQYYPKETAFNNLASVREQLTDDFVKNLTVDREGFLWIRSSGDLACYDIRNDRMTCHLSAGDFYGYIFIDSQNDLWLIRNHTLVEQYGIKGGKIVRRKKSIAFPGNVFSISEDRGGRIWCTLPDRFAILLPDGSFTYRYAPNGISFSQLQTLRPSGKMILYTLSNGIYEFGKDQQFIPLDSLYLPNPNSIIVDHENNYWIGTYNTGLLHYDPETQEKEWFDTSTGLVENNLKSVIEDLEGNIWFATSQCITKYNVQEKTFSDFYDSSFTKGKLYAMNCAAVTPDGTLCFGGSGGITLIHPDIPTQESADIPLNFDVVLVNGNVYTGDPGDGLTLDYRENMLTFWYSGLNFTTGSSLAYAYMLDGFDKEWIDAGTGKRAAYSNLPSGDYVFRVKVKKLNGEWGDNELTMNIHIRPAPWASPLAIALYILLGLALLGLAGWLIIRWRMQEERIALAERQKSLKQEHLDFVTNISHELRTPLTLIYAPLKELSKEEGLSGRSRNLIGTMQRNVNRLMKLSTQIMDTNKNVNEEKPLQVAQGNLSAFVQSLVENFRFTAHDKGLSLTVHDKPETDACFDAEKVEIIVYNLLSNAIKYTPEGGSIDISVESDGTTARICVTDTGEGIAPEKRDKLFNRFERLGADKKHPGVMGKGIGLNYAQTLAHLHKGHIDYAPNQPQGSRFTFSLPQQAGAYTPEEQAREDRPALSVPRYGNLPAENGQGAMKENTLLIAEDDMEVREYLRTMLAPCYNVIVTQNGEEALEWMGMNPPDLIVSDVVMPEKDGYELCRAVKTSGDWCHIPVVLLTAKNDTDSSIKGLDCGADAYVGKPFDPFYLKATIENLLANRRRIQQKIANLTSGKLVEKGKAREAMLNEQDRVFLEQIHASLDQHLDDEEFGISSLAKDMGMSYSSLYARIKSLTGQTPQNFLITYRMNTAMELLRTGKYTVSEVCYKVGSSSLANFSRSFKRQFGIPPSEA